MRMARRVYGPEAGVSPSFGPDTYRYQALAQELMRFCTVDLGAAYLDQTKDRLYTLPRAHPARRSAQSAMYWTLEILVRAFAPIVSFTAEEIWALMPARPHPSVFFATWAELDGIAALRPVSPEESALVARLGELRGEVNRQIEQLRNDGKVGGSLDAEVTLAPADATLRAQLAAAETELRFFFITSEVRLVASAAQSVEVRPTDHAKCVRCWHHRADVGGHAEHPELCGRCVDNVAGDGETRRWF